MARCMSPWKPGSFLSGQLASMRYGHVVKTHENLKVCLFSESLAAHVTVLSLSSLTLKLSEVRCVHMLSKVHSVHSLFRVHLLPEVHSLHLWSEVHSVHSFPKVHLLSKVHSSHLHLKSLIADILLFVSLMPEIIFYHFMSLLIVSLSQFVCHLLRQKKQITSEMQRELVSWRHMMPPQQHVCNGLARPSPTRLVHESVLAWDNGTWWLLCCAAEAEQLSQGTYIIVHCASQRCRRSHLRWNVGPAGNLPWSVLY